MTIRLTLRRILLGIGTLLLGGLLLGWSGLIYIGASGGHWDATEWFLHWVMRNSVRTHSLTVKAPDLGDPVLLDRAAGHYATGCAPCHGAPGERQNPIVQASLPPPPAIAERLDNWTAEELFRIVQHGVRYSGMPAWVATEREDEVWAMVAFLQELPRMEAETYRRLAFGEAGRAMPGGLQNLSGATTEVLEDCARCHGVDGRGRENAAFPRIGGQNEAYLFQALQAFVGRKRHSGIMQPAAARAEDPELREIAAHYARQPYAPAPQAADSALLAAGERIAREGIPKEGVPACLSCHGGAALRRNPAYPRLDGQHASYLENQLSLWRAGTRGGGPYGHVMSTVAERLPEDAAKAVSAWFATRGALPE